MVRSKTLRFIFLLAIMLGFVVVGNAQISGGGIETPTKSKEKKDKQKDKKVKEVKEPFDPTSLTGSSFYTTGMIIYSDRSFEDHTNTKLYSALEPEVGIVSYGCNVGILIPLSGNFALDLSATGFGLGESYSFSDETSDSTYYYKNTYVHGSIPLRLRYTYGTDVQLFGFAGIAPGNIFQLRTKSNYTKSDGGIIENEVEIANTDDYTPFTFTVSGGLGANYYFNQFGLTFSAEYRRNLTNTYANNVIRRTHNLYGISLNLGLTYRF